MARIRIYELAKELGVENKAVIQLATDLGIPGKSSHSHSLEGDEADQIRRALIRTALGTSATQEVVQTTKNGDSVTVRRKGNIIRRRKKVDTEEEAAPPATAPIEVADAIVEAASQEVQEEAEAIENEEPVEASEPATLTEEVVADEPSPVEASAEASTVDESVEEQPVVKEAAKEAAPEKKSKSIGPKILGKIELNKTKIVSQPSGNLEQRKRAAAQTGDDSDDKKGKKGRGKKREFSRGDLLDYDSRPKRGRKRKGGRRDSRDSQQEVLSTEKTVPKASKRVIKVTEAIMVGELAHTMGLKAGEIIGKLIDLGVMATINQVVDIETASIVAEEFGFQVESAAFEEDDILLDEGEVTAEQLMPRAPIVTVMGHVDHGKTTLLDSIRKTSIAAKESGGITQHIGAYNVELASGQKIAFIDTPGHEAFTSMRARGAQVTDIVILVVSADDGVMPQTREAVDHAKAAGVPIVVAINKMDKPGANPDMPKQQLSEIGLAPEDWGGDTMYYPVSALQGTGIEELLEGVLLTAEVQEYKADPTRRAKGTIIESRQDSRQGIVATVLVQEGLLKIGESFVSGAHSGRIRSMVDHLGNKLTEAGPSTPIEITGLNGVPEAGDDFHVVESDAKAKQVAEGRMGKKAKRDQLEAAGGPISLEEFARQAATEALPELNVILKADVQGSCEAVKESLERLSGAKVIVKVIHSSVGAITESDVKLAIASKAVVVGFGVRAEPRAARDAESSGVELRFYSVIYHLVDDIKKAMVGLLPPIKKEVSLGRAEVRDAINIPKMGTIAGSYITEGNFKRGAHVRLLRDNRVIFEGKLGSLRRFKDDVKEVQSGYECGIGIENYNDIKISDVIEAFEFEELEPTLED